MNRIQSAADRLRARFGPAPGLAVVLGSGMGAFADAFSDRIPYAGVGLPAPAVPGHRGEIALGEIEGRRVAALAGRVHLYEGYAPEEVVLSVRALAAWGVRGLILTSAVGGIRPEWRAGQVVVISDHLNLMGTNPLVGPNLDALGPRFPDQSAVYPRMRRELAARVAAQRGLRPVIEGVYAALRGPNYETPAEIRMLRTLGADVVGMSLVPEAMAANHAGLEILGLSVVANPAAGLSASPLTHVEVTEAMRDAAGEVVSLLQGLVSEW